MKLSGLTKKDMTELWAKNDMKMKFNDFEFSVNPKSIEISSSTNCRKKPIFGENTAVENVSVNPIVISGSGEIYGKNAEMDCSYLLHMLKTKCSYWLFSPNMIPVKAFLTEFVYNQSSVKNSYSYSFVFVEDCNNKSECLRLPYTIALDGENAFDIAFRCNASVDEIMNNNDIKTPFDISEGDKVVLR